MFILQMIPHSQPRVREIMVKGELIPKPESNFVRVKCSKCGNEQVIFDRPSLAPHCSVCDELLAEPTGGKARLKGEVLQTLG
jgi:small subunit ribosomal protein S27e